MINNHNADILFLDVCPMATIIHGYKMMCLKMCIIVLFETEKIDWINGQLKMKKLVPHVLTRIRVRNKS